MIEQFISAGEAAELLDLSLDTVTRRVDARILRGYKDPTTQSYVVSLRAVEGLLELREALRRSALLPCAPADNAALVAAEGVVRPALTQEDAFTAYEEDLERRAAADNIHRKALDSGAV